MNKQIIDIARIASLMEERHLDAQELCVRARIAPNLLKALLSGMDQSKMRCGIVFRIADVLGVEPRTLIRKEYCSKDD